MKDFSIDEIKGVIATIERSRATWRGNEKYTRFLDIELAALRHYQWLHWMHNEESQAKNSQAQA